MSVDHCSVALGVHPRTLQRWRVQGLRDPAPGESIEAWKQRVAEWRRSRRRRPGPEANGGESQVAAETKLKQLRAEKLSIEIKAMRGELHSKAACEAAFVARCGELRAAFAQLPDKLARKLYSAPSPEAIKIQVEEELRRCFAVLAGDEVQEDEGTEAGA